MKILVLALMLLSSINLLSEDKQLRIIKSNGEEEIFQLSEIKHLNFEQNTYSGICKFSLTNGDSVEFAVNEINSITFKQDLEQNDSIVVSYYSYKNDRYAIAFKDIKEITFFNKNQFKDYIYTKFEIQISGLIAVYSSGNRELKFNFQYSNDVPRNSSFDYFHCYPYTYPLRPLNSNGNINLSNHFYNGSVPDFYCRYYHTTIFINDKDKIIDSLILTRIWREHEVGSGGGWRKESDYEDRLRLYSIPFEFEGESIISEFKIDDLKKIKYYYLFNNITGSSGGHSTSTDQFIQFLEIKDNAKIIIKLN